MKDAYQMLFVNKEEIDKLDSENSKKADKMIRERLGQTRIFIYGDPSGNITNSGKSVPKIRQMRTFEELKSLISLDIEKIIAYDRIRTKSKREEYNKKLEREKRSPIRFLRLDEIQLQVNNYINSSLKKRNGKSINAYGIIDVLEPENEESWSLEKSEELDKKISNRYNILKEGYEQDIRAKIIKNFYTDEFDKKSLIDSSLMQLRLKWAYDKLKDRDSRREYNMDRKYSLNGRQLSRMRFYSNKVYNEVNVQDARRYIIDCDKGEFYLSPVTSNIDEMTALKQGKTIIYNTKKIVYKQDLGPRCELEEYAVKRMDKGQITTNHIITDNLNIASMSKSRTSKTVEDKEYANFVLGKMFSDYSINGCIKHRFGFIGIPNKAKDGRYEQYFEEEVLQFAKQLKEKSIVWGEQV